MPNTPEENFRLLMIGIEAALREEEIHERMTDVFFGTIGISISCKQGGVKHVRVEQERGYTMTELLEKAQGIKSGNLTPGPHSA